MGLRAMGLGKMGLGEMGGHQYSIVKYVWELLYICGVHLQWVINLRNSPKETYIGWHTVQR